MVWRILALSVGGALGVNARYWLGVWFSRWAGAHFPWATFAINISGSFAIGFLGLTLIHWWPHPNVRFFAITGFLGGYTTFSSFALETLMLWERGTTSGSLFNAFGSLAFGMIAVVLGVALGRAAVG